MGLFGSGGEGEAKLHEELKYLATSIESINQQLSSAQGGGVSQQWLQGVDRKLYTVYSLVQESEKRVAGKLDSELGTIRKEQRETLGGLNREIARSLSSLGSELEKMRSEMASTRSEVAAMRKSQDEMKGTISELAKAMRDQIQLARDQLELTKSIGREF